MELGTHAISDVETHAANSHVVAWAWWLARQSTWLVVAGLLAFAVANGLILASLAVIDRMVASSALTSLPPQASTAATLALFWQTAHPNGWIGPIEVSAIVGAVISLITFIVSGSVALTRVHRSEPISASLHRSFAGIVAIGPSISIHLLVCAAAVVLGRTVLFAYQLRYSDVLEGSVFIFPIAIGVMSITRRMADITDAMAGPPPTIPEKRCQDCGYDLSGHLDLPRCGECGSATASSLTTGLRRYPNAWEALRSAGSWLIVTAQVLLSPREFYSTLRMRNSLATARAFGRIHFVAIGLIAVYWLMFCPLLERAPWRRVSVWLLIVTDFALPILIVLLGTAVGVFVIRSPHTRLRIAAIAGYAILAASVLWWIGEQGVAGDFPRMLLLFCFVIAFAAPLVCWLGQRINGTVATLPFLGRDGLPDGRWAETVIAYESAFCWFFCVGWGLLAWSYFAFGDWISRWIGTSITYRIIGFPPEPAAILAVALIGGLIWQIRFRIALNAVRWANE